MKTYFPFLHLAILYAQIGRKDQAIESLEKAPQKHEMYPVQAKFNCFLDPASKLPLLCLNVRRGRERIDAS